MGPGCCLESGSSVADGSVLAIGVVIDAGKNISNLKLQAFPSVRCELFCFFESSLVAIEITFYNALNF